MRSKWSKLVVITIIAIACCGFAEAQVCGLATLNGGYSFRTSGTSFGIPGIPDGVPQTWVGAAVFDGAGNGTFFNTGSLGGFILEDGSNRTNFSYTLGRDCSGTFTAHFSAPLGDSHWNIVVSDNGKRILTINKDPGWVFSGEYYKQ
jgi:hypothetical protein